MSNGYKITRSNYTLKKRHQTLSGGVVYERDFMTTTNLGGWDSGSIPYGENNFKMYYRALSNAKKHTYHGEWLKNECNSGIVWTAECVPSGETSENKQIKIKPNYNSLLDFAYYGSCTELIKSTITKIIKTFPAEMFVFSGEEFGFERNILRNGFNINFVDKVVPEGENELRYFLKSYLSYYIDFGDGTIATINDAELIESNKKCNTFKVKIYTDKGNYNIEGKLYKGGAYAIETDDLPIGAKITPLEEIKEDFFNALDDFENVILNRGTNPKYTAILDTPFETENGVETYQAVYTWPSENGWNISIDTFEFEEYVKRLLSVANFYDEYYTNNLWRMLTHDSIKAMDIAYSNPEKDEDQDDYNVGTTRLEGLFWAFGRQFDEIKRYIENVKNTPRVTYNGNNNVPDYFLTDLLNLAGWEIGNIDTSLNKEDKTDYLFDGVLNGYNANDANNIFLKSLRLNSSSILGRKGTREGVENVLNLFGFMSYDMWKMLKNEDIDYDYKLDEFVGVVDNAYSAVTLISGETIDLLPLEKANLCKYSISTDTIEGKERDTVEGLPCAVKYAEGEDGIIYKYLVPWFNKNETYDGNLYFQARGGWGENNGDALNGVGYDETVKYIIIVDNVSDLKDISKNRIYNGVFAYVNNIESLPSGSSNYFELKNVEYSYVTTGDTGWNNISQAEIDDNQTPRAKKVNYIEHLVEDFKANNPHVGYGRYDFGQEYFEYLENPLKYSLEGDDMFNECAYDCYGNLIFSAKTFDINTLVKDNMKCKYFEPLTRNGIVECINGEEDNSGSTFESDVYTYDFVNGESGNTANEVTCDSIINSKRMIIRFYTDKKFKTEFENFIKTSVLPYLRQVLPSDVIYGYTIEDRNVINAEPLNTTSGIIIQDIDTIVSDVESGYTNDDIIVDFPADRPIDDIIIKEDEE